MHDNAFLMRLVDHPVWAAGFLCGPLLLFASVIQAFLLGVLSLDCESLVSFLMVLV